jgi:hypothetical protein
MLRSRHHALSPRYITLRETENGKPETTMPACGLGFRLLRLRLRLRAPALANPSSPARHSLTRSHGGSGGDRLAPLVLLHGPRGPLRALYAQI